MELSFICKWRAFYMPFCLTVWHIWHFAPTLIKKINFYDTAMAVLTNYALLCEQAYWIAFSKWKFLSVCEGKDLNCQNVSQWHFHTIKFQFYLQKHYISRGWKRVKTGKTKIIFLLLGFFSGFWFVFNLDFYLYWGQNHLLLVKFS